jgi:hypothetical protein
MNEVGGTSTKKKGGRKNDKRLQNKLKTATKKAKKKYLDSTSRDHRTSKNRTL